MHKTHATRSPICNRLQSLHQQYHHIFQLDMVQSMSVKLDHVYRHSIL